MPSPNDNPELLEDWKNLEEDLLSEGFSRNKSHSMIAEKYNISVPTVYRWLTPRFREREKKYAKKYRAERLTKKMKRKYQIKYRNKPEVRKRINEYQKKYLKLVRNLGTHIVNMCLEKSGPVGIEYIRETVHNNFNIKMKTNTVVNTIRNYNASCKKHKLFEVEKGSFYFSDFEGKDIDLSYLLNIIPESLSEGAKLFEEINIVKVLKDINPYSPY